VSRPSKTEWFLDMAELVARRSTCARRSVGCVLVNERGHVLATGYNGVAAGLPHCNEGHPCPGATAPSGTALDSCEAVHAEQNALLQCRDVFSIFTAYVTVSPCTTCVKLLLSTSTRHLVFRERYPHPAALELWTRAGRTWWQYGLGQVVDFTPGG
jgi:dCMP deaminase